MTINLTDPANHPANGPLTVERITRVRDELQRTMFYANGGVMDHIVVDAIKALEELLVRRGGEPQVLPCPVFLDPGLRFGKGVKTQLLFDALKRRAEYYAGLDGMTPEQRTEHDAGIAEFKAMLNADGALTNEDAEIPATKFKPVADLYGITSPTGSETSFTFDAIEADDFIKGGWSVQEYVELERYQEAIVGDFRGNGSSSTKHFREISEPSTNFPALSPIDHGFRPDCECSGCIATAAICAELTLDCRCRACRPVTMTDMRFVVCPDCGNKRCPHANDHRNACTGSNEPGQEGSAYPAPPQEVR